MTRRARDGSARDGQQRMVSWARQSRGGDAVGGLRAPGGGALVEVLGEYVRAEGEPLGLLDDLMRLKAEINRRD